jgi:hypothetical protein
MHIILGSFAIHLETFVNDANLFKVEEVRESGRELVIFLEKKY